MYEIRWSVTNVSETGKLRREPIKERGYPQSSVFVLLFCKQGILFNKSQLQYFSEKRLMLKEPKDEQRLGRNMQVHIFFKWN